MRRSHRPALSVPSQERAPNPIVLPALSALMRCTDKGEAKAVVRSLPDAVIPALAEHIAERTAIPPMLAGPVLVACGRERLEERIGASRAEAAWTRAVSLGDAESFEVF